MMGHAVCSFKCLRKKLLIRRANAATVNNQGVWVGEYGTGILCSDDFAGHSSYCKTKLFLQLFEKKITFLPQGNLSSILKTNTFFGDNISLCSQGWHPALDPPASAFQMPGLQVCTTTSSELLEDKVLSCFSGSDHGTQAVPQTCQQVEDAINTTCLPLQIPGPPLLPTFMDHTECHMVGQVGITICLYKPTFHHLNCC